MRRAITVTSVTLIFMLTFTLVLSGSGEVAANITERYDVDGRPSVAVNVVMPDNSLEEPPAKLLLHKADKAIESGAPIPEGSLLRMTLNGNAVFLDSPPRIKNKRILIPMRPLIEELGLKVQWDELSETAGISSGSAVVSFKIGSKKAFINGNPVTLPAAPVLVSSTSETSPAPSFTDAGFLVPVGIAAAFADIEWDEKNRVIRVNTQPLRQTQNNELSSSPILILMYHEIGDGPSTLFVRDREFEAQMRYLHESGYNVISMDTAMKVIRGEENVENGVVITFDDGYRTFYDKAWKILKKYSFPATVYVICSLSASDPGYISWEQMRFLEANWIDIGSHSISHQNMNKMANAELDREIAESKSLIERELIYPCKYFCYPGGFYSKNILEKIKLAGYDNAVTISSGKVYANSDLYKLPRLFIRRGVSPEKFEKILKSGIT